MKTITIKLPEREAKELEEFVKRKAFPSKSEFIRNIILEKLERNKKEKIGWMILAEQSMKKLWDNKEDEIWTKYL